MQHIDPQSEKAITANECHCAQKKASFIEAFFVESIISQVNR